MIYMVGSQNSSKSIYIKIFYTSDHINLSTINQNCCFVNYQLVILLCIGINFFNSIKTNDSYR